MYSTEQETFWAESFGDEYSQRNFSPTLAASNFALFSEVIQATGPVGSIIELGSNAGMNVLALRSLLPEAEIHGVDINYSACDKLRAAGWANEVTCSSILDFACGRTFDFVFTKGVLIHIAPQMLPEVYAKMYALSDRFLMVAEYFNPTPISVEYRGHAERLFKRDFAGDLLDLYSDLELVDYGFRYRRDRVFPQDDLSWFLLRKGGER